MEFKFNDGNLLVEMFTWLLLQTIVLFEWKHSVTFVNELDIYVKQWISY